nr:potassium channel family protein [Pectobacterium polaris]
MSTYKKIGHLKDLLNEHQAFNEKSLRCLIDGKSQIRHGEVTFKVLRPADLDLDSEQRSYLDNFDFQRTIFDCEQINLRNSSRVNLIDCIVLGTLSISDKNGEKTEVYLDIVAVTKQLRIRGQGEHMTSVSLVSVQARELILDNFTTPEVGVMSSRFASTVMRCLMAESLMIIDSELGALSITECNFQKVKFPAGQVCLGDLNASRMVSWLRKWRFKPLKFLVGPKAIHQALDSASRSEAKRREIETLNFLLERTDVSHSKRNAAKLKYLRSLAESSSWLSRFFVIATGGLIKPSRIVLWTIVVIFGFAGIYWQEATSFRDDCSIRSYWDALYFSGLTFTTVGYGDISPVNWMRGLAVLEGLLGIALSGAFLVSLTRRYIE